MSAIHPKITEVLTATFKVPAADITPEATMDSLEMDSLAVAEFAVVIRETLGVDTDAESVLRGATLAGITAFLTEHEWRADRAGHMSGPRTMGNESMAENEAAAGVRR